MRTTVNGQPVELVVGRRYIFGHQNGATGEVILLGRRRNGDLRVSGRATPEYGHDGEVWLRSSNLVRLELVPDSLEEVESDAGQAALEAAAKAARDARNGKGPKVAHLNDPDDDTDGVDPRFVKPKGTPYSQRNQVWRCRVCRRRTRAAFCDRGHPYIAAPAGKRKESRS